MKNTYLKSLSLLATMVTLASCAKEIAPADQPENTLPADYVRVPMTIKADVEPSDFGTKTILNGSVIEWQAGDKIAVWDGTAKNEFTAQSAGVSTDFTGEAADVASYVAISPYSCVTKTSDENTISVKLPGNPQTVDATHHVDPNALISSAKYDNGAGSFTMTNHFSLAKFTITRSDVLSVTLYSNATTQGNNDDKGKEEIYGTVKIDKSTGEISGNGTDAHRIILNFSDGESNTVFTPGDYYIALWPVTFSEGFTLVVKTTSGRAVMSTSSETTFPRNGGVDLGTIDGMSNWVGEEITTASQLKMFRRLAKYYTDEETVKLGADIDLDGYSWKPIESFAGTFDGQNHSITNFKVDDNSDRVGFFGKLESNAELKNTTFGSSVDDSHIKSSVTHSSSSGAWSYAGIVAYLSSGASISGVKTYVPVEMTSTNNHRHAIGGICGNMKAGTSIENCINYSTVTDNSSYNTTGGENDADCCLGGIVGMSDSNGSTITGCKNNGTSSGQITNNCICTSFIGGIVGKISGSNNVVENCENNAYVINAAETVYSNDNFKVLVGGVVGAVSGSNAQIIKCTCTERAQSSAVLTSRLGLGGIVGGATGAGLQILGCSSNTGTIRPEFVNNKDIAVGGIIGYSNNTILISKAEDGTLTRNLRGYQQTKAINGTAYIGGIAGLLDSNSSDNIVEYCETTSGQRLEFNNYGNKNKTANVGGIVGSTKGIVRNCTNNQHIYVRNNSADYQLALNYGGIVGGNSSSRTPKIVTNCTNNGNIGIYNQSNDPCLGGIMAALYPANTEVSYCTNRGIISSGQAKANGVICNIQTGSGTNKGALFGCVKDVDGVSPVTNCEGCVIDCKFIQKATGDYSWTGLICGWLSGKSSDEGKAKIIFGSAENPILIINSTLIETGTNADPTVETVVATVNDISTAKTYLFGSGIWSKNFSGGIDSSAFTDRFEWNVEIATVASSSAPEM